MKGGLVIKVSNEWDFELSLVGCDVMILLGRLFAQFGCFLIDDLVEAADNVEILVSVMKESLSTRENVQSKDLDFLRMISLYIESGHRLHLLCDLEMEIGKTGVGNYLSAAIIDVEIDTEQ